MTEIDADLAQRIRDTVATGRAILVTGAGFSLDAVDPYGTPLPTARKMAEEIWPISFGREPFDSASTLGDIFDAAMRENPQSLQQYLEDACTVDADRLPRRYCEWFALPWHRIYTLNVDDLEEAVQRLEPTNVFRVMSALTTVPADLAGSRLVAYVHVNGRAAEFPHVTFSPRDYADRTANPDPWLMQFMADLATRPAVFVGTQLEESTMWHYMQMRGAKPTHVDKRPRAFLVSRSLAVARQRSVESNFNTQYIESTEAAFFAAVFEGHVQQLVDAARVHRPSTVATAGALVDRALEQVGTGGSDYLFGLEPGWDDVVSGYAVLRSIDRTLRTRLLASGPTAFVLHGTAGSGVSTTLRQVAVLLNAEGKRVFWVNRDNGLTVAEIRSQIQATDPDYVFLDGADRLGSALRSFSAGVVRDNDCTFVCGMRSTRLDLLGPNHDVDRVVQPDLSNDDAAALVASLERAGRLGELRRLPTLGARVDRILKHGSKQLIVTMIEVTSGEKFTDKVANELRELQGEARAVYSLVCLATHLDEVLRDDDVVIGRSASASDVVGAIAQLTQSGLIRRGPHGGLTARHRVVADVAVKALRSDGHLADDARGLLTIAGIKAPPRNTAQDPYGRLLIRLLNHDFLYELLGDANVVRATYGSLERIFKDQFHFWLQRGEFEISHGDRSRAPNFLAQADAIEPGDILVETSRAHLSLVNACEEPTAQDAALVARDALNVLWQIISQEPRFSPHTYGVYVQYGLKWIKVGGIDTTERRALAEKVRWAAVKGSAAYPENALLSDLKPDAERIARQHGL